jgi:hypothetical protein
MCAKLRVSKPRPHTHVRKNTHRVNTISPSPSNVGSCTACRTRKCWTMPYTSLVPFPEGLRQKSFTCFCLFVCVHQWMSTCWVPFLCVRGCIFKYAFLNIIMYIHVHIQTCLVPLRVHCVLPVPVPHRAELGLRPAAAPLCVFVFVVW